MGYACHCLRAKNCVFSDLSGVGLVSRCGYPRSQLKCSADEVAMRGQKRSSKHAKKISFSLAASTLALGLWASAAHSQSDPNEAAAQRGRKQFQQACGFCHAQDAPGGRWAGPVCCPPGTHHKEGE